MAVPWPVSLQQLVNSQSFSYRLGETLIKSDVDIGPVKVRRRFTRPIETVSVSINLTQAQFTTLRTFFNTTVNGGATIFELNHPITGVLTNFRFMGPPEIRPLGSGGTEFQASMSWEIMP